VGHIETVTAPPLVSLSERDSIHFCPFCGSDLCPSPCRECGEAMEGPLAVLCFLWGRRA
jgi:hypothetical protein